LAGCILVPSAPAAQETRPFSPFGVAAHLLWSDRSNPEVELELDRMAAAGVRWVRFDVGWVSFEPNKGDFSTYFANRLDWITAEALNRGIEPQLNIISTPGWANGNRGWRYPPTNPSDISGFVNKLVSRYKGRIRYFEIWNEPDASSFWRPAPDAVAYVQMLRAAYVAAKQANPDAQIISGGLMGNDTEYLQQMYDAGAGGHFDLLGLHPYTGAQSPNEPAAEYNTRWNFYGIPLMRAVMDANGDTGKKIWVSEFGWQTSGHGDATVSLTTQARYVGEAYDRLFRDFPYIEAMCVYDFRNDGTDTQNPEHHFGLLYHGFTAKPSYYTYGGSSLALWPRGRVSLTRSVVPYTSRKTLLRLRLPASWGECTVTIQRLVAGSRSWETLLARRSREYFSMYRWPTSRRLYRALIDGHDPTPATRVQVRSVATIAASRSWGRRVRYARVSGRVIHAPRTTVCLRQRVSGRWKIVRRMATDAGGRFTALLRFSRSGSYYYHVWYPGNSSLIGTRSRSVRVLVR